jgi:hypothetical protein
LRDLVGKADKGDEEAVPAIREILDRSPGLAWRMRNVGRMAELLLIGHMTKDEDLAAKEMIEYQLHSMRSETAGVSRLTASAPANNGSCLGPAPTRRLLR